jgi:hypothetical protein
MPADPVLLDSIGSVRTQPMIPATAVLLHKLLRSAWCIGALAMAFALLVEWGLIAEQSL